MSGGLCNGVAMAVGRCNPVTRGHSVMFLKLVETAKRLGATPIFYLVDGEKSSKDKSKNPLTVEQRLKIIRKLYPELKIDVVSSAYEALEVIDLQGYKVKAWIAGSDRASNYRKLLSSEKLEAEVVEVDREAGDADGVSATKARNAALNDNIGEFANMLPEQLSTKDLTDIMVMIREATNGGLFGSNWSGRSNSRSG